MSQLEGWTVATIPLDVCQKLVAEYHYTGGGSNTAVYRHGLQDLAGRTRGCCWWLPPTKGAAKYVYPEGDWRKVLTLSRLVLDPDVPKNGASYMLGRSMRLIQEDHKWECLVTYADEGQGHTGAIYLATNWEPIGKTVPAAHWVDSKGRFVARKAGPKTRTNAEMESLGYHVVAPTAKRRFRKVLL